MPLLTFTDPLVFALSLAVTGAVTGLLGGLFGIGGGLVMIPTLVMLLEARGIPTDHIMHLATGISLLTIVPVSVSSIHSHAKRGSVDWMLVKLWGPLIVVGSVFGSLSSSQLPGHWLKIIFGFYCALMAALLCFVPTQFQSLRHTPGKTIMRATAFLIGGLSGIIGIGGGSLTVPTLTFYRTPILRAIGTSSSIGLLIALPATVVFITAQYLQYQSGTTDSDELALVLMAFAILAPLTMVTAPFGARLAHHLQPTMLRRLFAFLLLMIAVKMLLAL